MDPSQFITQQTTPCKVFTLDKKLVGEYPSIKKASMALGFSANASALRGQFGVNGKRRTTMSSKLKERVYLT